jgi:hypothetical protein
MYTYCTYKFNFAVVELVRVSFCKIKPSVINRHKELNRFRLTYETCGYRQREEDYWWRML